MSKKKIDTINLYSSLFTRTLMTGLNIIEKLSLKNNNIFITNILFEIASLNNFKYYPLDSLLINNKNENKNLYSKFINNYLEKIDNFEGIKKFKEKEIEPKYPENFVDAVNRYTKILTIVLALIEGLGLYFSYKSSGVFINPGFLTATMVIVGFLTGTSIKSHSSAKSTISLKCSDIKVLSNPKTAPLR